MTLHNFRILCPTAFLFFDAAVRERSIHNSCWWTVRWRTYRNSFLGTFFVALMVESHKRAGTWRRKVDRFIALTQFAKDKFVEGGLRSESILVKSNSSSDISVQASSERSGALYIGRLSPEKGVRELVQAWSGIETGLTIVGDGPLATELKLVGRHNIRFLGQRSKEEVARLMCEAEFLILPSVWHEMFPMVIPEAFSCATPIIASNVSGLPGIIRHGETGLIFDSGDLESLRDRLQWALTNRPAMRRMGQNARAEFETKYTHKANYGRLMAIYHEVIAEKLGQLKQG